LLSLSRIPVDANELWKICITDTLTELNDYIKLQVC
jgi:hypothetical protein